jgi:hypothetical protein
MKFSISKSKIVASVLAAFTVLLPSSEAWALNWLSIGSAHASDTLALTSDNNGLEHIDWHMHNCAFKKCFADEQPLDFSVISQIMDTRSVMTMETDQEYVLSGWELDFYNMARLYSNYKPVGNYAVNLRPYMASWDQNKWLINGGNISDTNTIPGELLSYGWSGDNRNVFHYIPADASPTSTWTPYQQDNYFPWGDYLNINAGITFDMPASYYLNNLLPPKLTGFSGLAWKAHIKHMFNQCQGKRWVYIVMSGRDGDTAKNVTRAMSEMLKDGMKVDGFIVANFSGAAYQGGPDAFVRDMNIVKNHFLYLRGMYP